MSYNTNKKNIYIFVSGGVGGAERVTLTISKLLNKNNYNIHIVITDYPSCPLSAFLPKDIPTTFLKEKHLHWKCFLKIKRILLKEKPDYAFTSMTFICIILLVLKILYHFQCKIIIRGQINPQFWKKYTGKLKYKGFIIEKISRLLYPFAYKVVAQTPTMQQGMIKHLGISPKNCICLYNPIDINNINLKLKEESPYPPSSQYRYVAIGRCQYQKGYDLLIKAAKKVIDFNPNSHIYIIGAINNDSYSNQLFELCRILNLENNIHFEGFQTNPYKYIKYANCFILSSRDEGLPNVLIEATYMQCPAIAYTCIPIIEEIIQNNKNGLLVEPENIEKLANAMIKIQSLTLNAPSLYKPSNADDFNNLFN